MNNSNTEKQNILFLTLQYPLSMEKELLGKSTIGLQAQINTFQTALCKGFAMQKDVNTTILATLPVGGYPKYFKECVLHDFDWDLNGLQCHEIGFINIQVLKQFSRVIKYWKQVKQWIKNTEGKKTILIYSMYLPFERILKLVKKKYPDVNTCMICTDLPGGLGIRIKNRIVSIINNLRARPAYKLTKYVDSFVLLTDAMKYPLNVGNRPYVVVEGIADEDVPYRKEPFVSEEKVILYTGSLNEEFGIMNLIDAFMQIEEESYRLVICGTGDAEDKVKDACKKDNRIQYLGYVTKAKVYDLQLKSTLLVNPRQNIGEYTKYSFPSKTMEYMASGVPILMYKLDGIPDEYLNYLYYVSNNSVETFKEIICNICNQNSNILYERGLLARKFVTSSKSFYSQSHKLRTMWDKESL